MYTFEAFPRLSGVLSAIFKLFCTVYKETRSLSVFNNIIIHIRIKGAHFTVNTHLRLTTANHVLTSNTGTNTTTKLNTVRYGTLQLHTYKVQVVAHGTVYRIPLDTPYYSVHYYYLLLLLYTIRRLVSTMIILVHTAAIPALNLVQWYWHKCPTILHQQYHNTLPTCDTHTATDYY
jgi:hypothetical protein